MGYFSDLDIMIKEEQEEKEMKKVLQKRVRRNYGEIIASKNKKREDSFQRTYNPE